MQMVDDARVVVYLMTGFLESGKTSFLKQTIDKQYFKIDGTTIIILCEEGASAKFSTCASRIFVHFRKILYCIQLSFA